MPFSIVMTPKHRFKDCSKRLNHLRGCQACYQKANASYRKSELVAKEKILETLGLAMATADTAQQDIAMALGDLGPKPELASADKALEKVETLLNNVYEDIEEVLT